MKRKDSLISGTIGKNESYLAEFLLDKGHIVHSFKRIARRGFKLLHIFIQDN